MTTEPPGEMLDRFLREGTELPEAIHEDGPPELRVQAGCWCCCKHRHKPRPQGRHCSSCRGHAR